MTYRVKEWREKRHLTQDELAEKSGVSRATIAALESGNKKTASVRTLMKLADALGVRVDKIFCA